MRVAGFTVSQEQYGRPWARWCDNDALPSTPRIQRGAAAQETLGSGRTPPLHLGLKFQEETVAVAGPFVASGRDTMARVVGPPSSMASSTRPLGHPFKPGARHYHINPAAASPSDPLPLFPCSSSSKRDLFVGHPWRLPRYLFTRRSLLTMLTTLWMKPFKASFCDTIQFKVSQSSSRHGSTDFRER